jgi:hypothetical protein
MEMTASNQQQILYANSSNNAEKHFASITDASVTPFSAEAIKPVMQTFMIVHDNSVLSNPFSLVIFHEVLIFYFTFYYCKAAFAAPSPIFW